MVFGCEIQSAVVVYLVVSIYTYVIGCFYCIRHSGVVTVEGKKVPTVGYFEVSMKNGKPGFSSGSIDPQ